MKHKGCLDYSIEEEDYIRANWKTKSDKEMAKFLNRTTPGIQYKRIVLGLRKDSRARTSTDCKARVCEMFANGSKINRIARTLKMCDKTVSTILSRHWFRVPKGRDTITLTIESKLNYDRL